MKFFIVLFLVGLGVILGVGLEERFGVAAIVRSDYAPNAPAENSIEKASETERPTPQEEAAVRIPIPADRITDGQRAMLQKLGIDPTTVTITAEAKACAEGELGADRVAEIQAGATPSWSEGIVLVACYKK